MMGARVLALVALPALALGATILDPAMTADVILNPINPDSTLEADWSPCSAHVLTVHKRGFITKYDNMSPASNINAVRLADFQDEVYSFWDHAFSALKFHPKFPAEPYIYLLYSAEPKVPWGDNCDRLFDGISYCNAYTRLVRLKLDVTMAPAGRKCADFTYDATNPDNKVILLEDWCMSSITHSAGDLVFLDNGDLLLTAGEGAQYATDDPGLPDKDVCYVPSMGMPQGRFRSQRTDFIHGKVVRVKAASLLANRRLTTDDYTFAAIGLRNPYTMTRDPVTGDVYVGDVGSSLKEEINVLYAEDLADPTNPPVNFGWPCVEGKENPMETDEWFATSCNPKTDQCDLCDNIWPCIPYGNGGKCDRNYRPPVFEYRGVYPPLDPRYPQNCASGAASITALAFWSNQAMPHNLVAGDLSYGCLWYFDRTKDGKPDFASGPRVLLANHGITSAQIGPDGNLYTTTDFGVYQHTYGAAAARRLAAARGISEENAEESESGSSQQKAEQEPTQLRKGSQAAANGEL